MSEEIKRSEEMAETHYGENEIQVLQIASESIDVQPEESYIKKEVTQILADAIDKLRDNLKTVISLYYVEGLAMHEIAQVLQVSDSRVSQMHKAAITALKDLIKEQLE